MHEELLIKVAVVGFYSELEKLAAAAQPDAAVSRILAISPGLGSGKNPEKPKSGWRDAKKGGYIGGGIGAGVSALGAAMGSTGRAGRVAKNAILASGIGGGIGAGLGMGMGSLHGMDKRRAHKLIQAQRKAAADMAAGKKSPRLTDRLDIMKGDLPEKTTTGGHMARGALGTGILGGLLGSSAGGKGALIGAGLGGALGAGVGVRTSKNSKKARKVLLAQRANAAKLAREGKG